MMMHEQGTNKKWIPKNDTMGGTQTHRTKQNVSNHRSLINHKTKSFSEAYSVSKPIERTNPVRSYISPRGSLNAASPVSSPSSSPPAYSFVHHPSQRTVSTNTTSTSTRTYKADEHKGRHKRSISDPFKEENEQTMTSPVNFEPELTFQDPNLYNCMPSSRSRAHSWHKQQNQIPNFTAKRISPKRPVALVDAYTQTTQDATTQTSDEDFTQEEDYIIKAAQLLIRGAMEKKRKKCDYQLNPCHLMDKLNFLRQRKE